MSMGIRISMKRFLVTTAVCIFGACMVNAYTLDEIKMSMHDNNPDIRSARQEYDQSIYDYKDALANMGPKVDLQISGTYMLDPPIGEIVVNVDDLIDSIKWPANTTPNKTGESIKVYDGMDHTLYSFGFSVEQPIFTWGKLYHATQLYKKVSAIQKVKYMNTMDQLDTELETRIISLQFLKEIREKLLEEKEYVDTLVKISDEAYHNGALLRQDFLEAQIQSKEIDMAVQNIYEEVTGQLIQLQYITGLDDLTLDNIEYVATDDLIQYYDMDSATKESVMEKALSPTQPSIQMVTELRAVNEIAERIAKDSLYWKPDIGFQASLGYGGSSFPFIQEDWKDKDDYSVTLTLGIKATIYDGGKKFRDVSRSKSKTEASSINVDSAVSTIRKTLQDQFNAIDSASIKVEYQELKIETAKSKIEQEEKVYRAGYGSQANLLKAKINRCNEEIQLLQQELSRCAAAKTVQFFVGALSDGE